MSNCSDRSTNRKQRRLLDCTAPVSQGTAHCVGVRSTVRSAGCERRRLRGDGLVGGYTATINNCRGWDNIADLRPSQIVNQDDRTVNIGLPFVHLLRHHLQPLGLASNDGWMSMGGANIGVDTGQPSAAG